MKENKEAWPLIEFWVDNVRPDGNHIRAYEEFITRAKSMINNTIEMGNTVLKLENLKIVAPYQIVDGKKVPIYPCECIEQKESYSGDMFCDIECTVYGEGTPSLHQVFPDLPNDINDLKSASKYLKDNASHICIKITCENKYCACKSDYTFHVKEKLEASKGKKVDYKEVYKHIHIGTIPVMVGSILCNLTSDDVPKEIREKEFKYGLGGYFIHKGTSRFIMFQERSTFNRFMTFDDESAKSKNKKFSRSIEVRNSATDDAPTSLITLGIQKDGNFYVNMKYLQEKKFIPAIHFFYAMGIMDPEEILKNIISRDDPFFETASQYLLKFFEHGEYSNYIDEIGSLGKDKVNDKELHVMTVIDKHFLHHYKDIPSKARYYGWMILSLIKFIEGHIPPEDRDHFGKKVVDTEASLFSNVFYTSLRKTISEITSNLEKSLGKTLNGKILFPIKDSGKMPITTGFTKALTMNNWGGTEKKDGVCQVFSPHNYAGAIISLQKCSLHLQKMNKKKKPRMVHGSMYGIIDFFDTPDNGEMVGYVKCLSALAFVTNQIDISNILTYISNKCSKMTENDGEVKVFNNNHWIANTTKENAIKIEKKLRKSKRFYKVEPTVSIVYNDIRNELHIHSLTGRLMRPWLVVEDGKILYNNKLLETWNNLEDALSSGTIEMLDQNELEFTMVSPSLDDFYSLSEEERKEIQYCDIHPATILGAGAGSITDPSRNQGPRNAFGAGMKKQAIGTTGRFDSPRTLFYPQKSLVENKLANVLLKYDRFPAGMNINLAFCPYQGMTIEDGSVVSKTAIEMGLFWTDKVTVHIVEISDVDREFIEIPDPKQCMRYRSYRNHNLDKNGIVKEKSIINENDVLCGKTCLEDGEEKPKRDESLLYRDSNTCYVKSVSIIEKGYKKCKIIKIETVEIKIPEWGNKIAPSCAQKTTISEIVPLEDMPFCPYPNECPTPTIIYGPLCMPSRMTISLLYEMYLGNYVCARDYKRMKKRYQHEGVEDCTQFNGNNEEKLLKIMDILHKMGYRRDGCVEMYNGLDGKPIETHIFTGIVHMQVLKHMVSDKISYRASGAVESVTRMPIGGRTAGKKAGSHGSATKTGVMEKSCLIANGVGYVLLDRMCLSSSKYNTTVCTICGIIETVCNTKNKRCRSCRIDSSMQQITIPYAIKLVSQELMSLGICLRFLTGEKKVQPIKLLK